MKRHFIRIEQSRLALFERLSKETDVILNCKPDTNSWSAMQTAYHLLSTEESILAYMKKKSQADVGSLKSKSISSYFRIFALINALKSGKKFKAPPVLDMIPEFLSLKEIEQKFAANRLSISSFINKLESEGKLNKEIFKHPRAGYFTIGQTLQFLEIHFERHAVQIDKAIEVAKQ
jgi:DinB superfamily